MGVWEYRNPAPIIVENLWYPYSIARENTQALKRVSRAEIDNIGRQSPNLRSGWFGPNQSSSRVEVEERKRNRESASPRFCTKASEL